MTDFPLLRRRDRIMDERNCKQFLKTAAVGHLATVSMNGWPYVIPISFVYINGKIHFHHVVKEGHLNSNIKADSRACFEIEEPGEVISTGSTAANTTVVYKSVIVFGNVNEILAYEYKRVVLEGFMHKYAAHLLDRPLTKESIDNITIYSMSIENITGKERKPDTP